MANTPTKRSHFKHLKQVFLLGLLITSSLNFITLPMNVVIFPFHHTHDFVVSRPIVRCRLIAEESNIESLSSCTVADLTLTTITI